jgi:hypothetical protein
MPRFLQQPDGVITAAALAATDSAITQANDYFRAAVAGSAIANGIDHMKLAIETALVQADGIATATAAADMEPVLAFVKQISLQAWEVGVGLNGTNGTSLQEILEQALKLLEPAITYIIENPWVLIPILIPALDAWLLIMGFEAGGIVAG